MSRAVRSRRRAEVRSLLVWGILALGGGCVWAQSLADRSAFAYNQAGQRLLAQRQWRDAASEFQSSLKLDPKQPDIEIKLGIALSGARDREGATQAFERAIALDPRSADAHFNVAVAYRELGEMQRALTEVKSALKLRPNYEEAEVALGLILEQSGQPDAAITQYQQTLRRHPQSVEARNWLGVAYLQKNRLSEAEAQFRAAIKLKPQYVRAYNNLGSTLAQGGDVAAGIGVLREGLKQAPDNEELRLNLAMALKAAGKSDEAVALLSALAKEHADDGAYSYQLGQALRQKGDLAGAVAEFEKTLTVNGEMQEAYYALASALKEETAAKRRESSKGRKTPSTQAMSLYRQGETELAKNDLRTAIDRLRQAVALDSGYADAHNMLGFALGKSGNLNESIEELRTAVKLDERLAAAHYNLGVALWYRGDRGEARTELESAEQLDPAAANTASFLGMVYREAGELERARPMCQRAIALSPKTPYTYFDLAVVYLREGHFDQALGQFESGLNLDGREGPIPDLNLTIEELQRALAANNTSADGFNTLGRLLGLAGADDTQVINAFQEAIRLRPDFPEAHNNLGLVYTQAGDDEKAAAEFREAVRIWPEFADAHQNLGTVLVTSDAATAVRELQRALALQPGLLKAQYNLALAYDANPTDGLTKEIEQLRKLVAAEPGYPHAEFALGKALLKSGKAEEAVEHLQSAVRNEPDYGQAHYQLGLALARVGKKAESAASIEKGRKLIAANEKQESGSLDLRQGRAALEAGKTEEALALLERVSVAWPDSAEAQYWKGMALKQKGETGQAVSAFQRALELKPGYIEAKEEVARLAVLDQPDAEQKAIENAISQGNFADAESRLQKYLETKPKSSWGWYALGYCYYGDRKLGESIRALAQSLQLDLKNAEAHKVLGRDMMMIGRFDAAKLEFEQGTRYAPRSAEMPYNLGKLHSIQDNWPQAKQSFEKALALDPDFMEAHDGLGLALESIGDKDGAIAQYQKAIELNEGRHGHFGAAYVNMSALYNNSGDAAKALEFAKRGLAANPKSDRALYQMAKAYERDGKTQEAVDCLTRAIELNPNSSSYFYLLATSYRRLGKADESRQAMASFTKLNNLTNELEQKRINWFKEEGDQVQSLQHLAKPNNN